MPYRRLRRAPRRGVILLVVLCLLTLFLLITLAFTVATLHAWNSSKAVSRVEQTGDPSAKVTQRVFEQVVRGTNDPLSAIGPHSLLEDLYGAQTQRGAVNAAPAAVGNGEFLQFEVRSDDALPPYNGYWNGRVLTFETGAAAGQSVRVVGYLPAAPVAFVRIQAPRSGVVAMEDLFIVNSREFNGYGAGYNPNTFVSLTGATIASATEGLLDFSLGLDGQPGIAGVDDDGNMVVDDWTEIGWGGSDDRTVGPDGAPGVAGTDDDGASGVDDPGEMFFPGSDDTVPLALLPNGRNPELQRYLRGFDGVLGVHPGANGVVGPGLFPDGDDIPADDYLYQADEDYDAADYQNMFLAATSIWLGPDGVPSGDDASLVMVPSFHQPALLNCVYFHGFFGGPDGAPGVASVDDDGLNGQDDAGEIGWQGSDDYYPPAFLSQQIAQATLRRAMLRPSPLDHPNFTGSNPRFHPVLGNRDVNGDGQLDFYWDVDNDGDGLADSVWVDVGLEVQTMPDGRRYKPLAALLIRDLDSRFNLNAHGTYDQIARPNPRLIPGIYAADNAVTAPTGQGAFFPGMHGQGYSPAEINLGVLVNPLEFFNLLAGDSTGTIEGRYGEGYLRAAGFAPGAGRTAIHWGADGGWGNFGVDDDLDGLMDNYTERGWPGSDDVLDPFGDDNYPISPSLVAVSASIDSVSGDQYLYNSAGPYGTAADPNGTGITALDLAGQPLTQGVGQPGQTADDPEEINLYADARRGLATAGGRTQADNPFTAADLERLLRWYDADTRLLSQRLPNLAPGLASNPISRERVTTESWDLVVPGIEPPIDIRAGLTALGHIRGDLTMIDLLRGKLEYYRQLYGNGALPVVGDVNASAALLMIGEPYTDGNGNGRFDAGEAFADLNGNDLWDHEGILAPELLMGMKLDINRYLGNNQDDNGNGVVDEPEEVAFGERLWVGSAFDPASAGLIPVDNNADGLVDGLDQLARQRLARHLFTLLLLLTPLDFFDEFPTETPALTPADQRELTVRRLAQFAINAVEFRDRDRIITPFEYDVNPFNGWNVDGFLGNNPGPDRILDTDDDSPSPDRLNADRRVVWGCESPDVLLTETVAFHDRRTTDTGVGGDSEDTDGDSQLVTPGEDNDYDQERIPEGSAFVELFCTRNRNNGLYTGDLYDLATGGLDLARFSPARPGGDAYPVWRLAISESRVADADNNVSQRLTEQPSTTTLQPENFNVLNGGVATVAIERIVWFANVAPGASTVDADRIYYNHNPGGALLGPSQYLVVGPYRDPTYQANYAAGAPAGAGDLNVTRIGWQPTAPAVERIDLGDPAAGRAFGAADNNGDMSYTYPDQTTSIQPVTGVAVAGDRAGGRVIGLSVSEPLFSAGNYYPLPTDPATATDYSTVVPGDTGLYYDRYATAFDEPLDVSRKLGAEGLYATDTYENYCTVFLQRLADPLLPWNPEPYLADNATPDPNHIAGLPVNPYISVDWLPLDLTVFNGSAPSTSPTAGGTWDARDPSPDAGGNEVLFSTRERGTPRDGSGYVFNVWSAVSQTPPDPSGAPYRFTNPTRVSHFGHCLNHSLGYLNESYWNKINNPPKPAWWDTASLSSLAVPYPATLRGDPTEPFPWLNIPHRPLVGALELLEVPASSPQRLLFEFSLRNEPNAPGYVYEPNANDSEAPRPNGHLLNFFRSLLDPATRGSGPILAGQVKGNFHRIFDFVGVPSRMSGASDLLGPAVYRAGSPAAGEFYPFYAPFNRLTNFREPGRINLNTVAGLESLSLTSNAIFGGLSYGNAWQRWWYSRKGYGGSGLIFELNPAIPTYFANPFRTSSGGPLVPLEILRHRLIPAGLGTDLFPHHYAEAGLLRSDRVGNQDPNPSNSPLFDAYVTSGPINTDRNPAFRYQALERLSNLVTNRSNVYAIWITIGRFEVTDAPIDPADPPDRYPDGLQLGAEIGSDTGEIVRNRAFYLFDRSRPIGFERGRNHNLQDGVLLQRQIQ